MKSVTAASGPVPVSLLAQGLPADGTQDRILVRGGRAPGCVCWLAVPARCCEALERRNDDRRGGLLRGEGLEAGPHSYYFPPGPVLYGK